MYKIIIWGASGQAIVIEELLSHYEATIVAFFENDTTIVSPVKGIRIYYKKEGFKRWLSTVSNIKEYHYIVAIGGNNGKARQKISTMLKNAGLQPFSAIHPTTFVAKNAVLGNMIQLLANSCICAKVKLGNNVIVNTSASIDHECMIEDGVHIGPGAKLAGCVQIGKNSFIGTGAIVLPRIVIGENVVIGAGSVVTKNIPSNSVAYGNPCAIKKRKK